MKAMILKKIYDLNKTENVLELVDKPKPEIDDEEILIKVKKCGVCHTELDEIEGRTSPAFFPIILGHEVVGRIEKIGQNVQKHKVGDRVGVAWIWSACGKCEYCQSGQENLCPNFKATGRDAHGGYAEYTKVHQDFAYSIPELFSDSEAAPLLCAGGVGYRSLKLTELKDKQNLGLTGFGASNHLVLKFAKYQYPNTKIFVFARNPEERQFALELGADWAGDTTAVPPELCNAIIDTTPVWKPVMAALKVLKPGGRLVINAIRKEKIDKEELLKMQYEDHLWLEKEIKSVANVTTDDVQECLHIAAKIKLKPSISEYRLEEANLALHEIKKGKIKGAKVLNIDD